MENFEFYAPTRMIFGKDTHLKVGKLIREYGFKKVLIHFGGGSVKRTGLLDTVCRSLEEEGIGYVLLGGVQANPVLSMARKGIELCRREQVDFILAVGGGSVIDSSKCIADGVGNPDVDVWKFHMKEAVPKKALPVGVILTLAAAGSEMSASCVITNEENGLKRGFNSVTHRPLFSICNPELTYTVNAFQTGCGTVDIMMHTLERYFSLGHDTSLTDRMAEGLLKAVIEAGRIVHENPEDYEARAALMWAGSLSHNDLTGAGRQVFMPVHQLEHEVSGMYPEVAHGAGLAALWCSWARYVYKANINRWLQYAQNVWNVDVDFEHPEKTIETAINQQEAFYASIGMPTNLQMLGVKETDLETLAFKCSRGQTRTLIGYKELAYDDILEVFQMAYDA